MSDIHALLDRVRAGRCTALGCSGGGGGGVDETLPVSWTGDGTTARIILPPVIPGNKVVAAFSVIQAGGCPACVFELTWTGSRADVTQKYATTVFNSVTAYNEVLDFSAGFILNPNGLGLQMNTPGKTYFGTVFLQPA